VLADQADEMVAAWRTILSAHPFLARYSRACGVPLTE
jgi:hypothetical protein